LQHCLDEIVLYLSHQKLVFAGETWTTINF
jgi:hypothetical protein